MITSAEDVHQHRPSLSSQSSQSSLSLIFQPWPDPVSVTIDHLNSSIESASSTQIVGLKWCKDRKGVKHHFLLAEVERPESNNLWIRLDRRAQSEPIVEDWDATIHPSSPTTAVLCDDPYRLVFATRSIVKAETEFRDPPPLNDLRSLLLVLESSYSKSYPEDAFFCSIIYDYLSTPPSALAVSFAPSVKANIKKFIAARQSMNIAPTGSQHSSDEEDGTDDEMLQEESSETIEDMRDGDGPRIVVLKPAEPRRSIEKIAAVTSSRDTDLVSSSSPSDLGSASDDKSSAAETILHDKNEKRRARIGSSLPSLPRVLAPGSVTSGHSNPFTHQWALPITMPISSLLSYVESVNIHIISLKWCRDRKRIPHEFLLLEMERPRHRTSWLRLDRRADHSATRMEVISSTSASADTAMLCANIGVLFDPNQSDVQVETEFADPPGLETLGGLLTVLTAVSSKYKLYPENCMFFCSVIYSHLSSRGVGKDVFGIPGKFAMSLAPKIRAEVDARLNGSSFSDGHPNLSYDNDQLQGIAETRFAAHQFRVAVLATKFWQRLRNRAQSRREGLTPIEGTNAIPEYTPDKFRVAVLATKFWQRLKHRAQNRKGEAASPIEPRNVTGAAYSTTAVNLSNDAEVSGATVGISGAGTTAANNP